MAMDNAGHRRPAPVADRVGQLLGGDRELGGARHELRRDRVVRIGRIDQRRHVLGHGDGELIRRPPDFVEPLGPGEPGRDQVVRTQGQAVVLSPRPPAPSDQSATGPGICR